MLTGYAAEFRRIAIILLIALAAGFALGDFGIPLFLGSLVYIFLGYRQMNRLQHWLEHSDQTPP